jgi:hydroxymethylpyrimidine/phosphomethylpyrimidine kinase
MKKVLSIAGSDCSGGAGIQADIKTITAHHMYAMSVITALTAQNTTGVRSIYEVSPQFVSDQLDMVFSDIFPDAVKIGMVSSKEIVETIMIKLREYKVHNIVLDPVMISTSGRKLLQEDAVDMLMNGLIPMATVITPNLLEAEHLCGFRITSKNDMQSAAIKIAENYSGDILIKGGHLKDCCDDLLYSKGKAFWYNQERVDNPNTHGTGCTLSSAIACNLAEGKDIKSSIAAAKIYITGALSAELNIGKGSGPLNHCWNMKL